MINARADTYTIDIFMAGDIAQAKQIMRKYCRDYGFCVHIHAEIYIYTGGEEEGFKIGIVNYPRFPSTREALEIHAGEIVNRLLDGLYQDSALLMYPNKTVWVTRREQK